MQHSEPGLIPEYANAWSKEEKELKDLTWNVSEDKLCADVPNERKDEVLAYFERIGILPEVGIASTKDNHFKLMLKKEDVINKLKQEEKNIGLLLLIEYCKACMKAGIADKNKYNMAEFKDKPILNYYSHCTPPDNNSLVAICRKINQEEIGFPYVYYARLSDNTNYQELMIKYGFSVINNPKSQRQTAPIGMSTSKSAFVIKNFNQTIDIAKKFDAAFQEEKERKSTIDSALSEISVFSGSRGVRGIILDYAKESIYDHLLNTANRIIEWSPTGDFSVNWEQLMTLLTEHEKEHKADFKKST